MKLSLLDVREDDFAPGEVAGGEEVEAVVGEVGAEVAVGVAEGGMEVDPGGSAAFHFRLKLGVDVADDLLLANHFFIASERVVDGQHRLHIKLGRRCCLPDVVNELAGGGDD